MLLVDESNLQKMNESAENLRRKFVTGKRVKLHTGGIGGKDYGGQVLSPVPLEDDAGMPMWIVRLDSNASAVEWPTSGGKVLGRQLFPPILPSGSGPPVSLDPNLVEAYEGLLRPELAPLPSRLAITPNTPAGGWYEGQAVTVTACSAT